MSTALTPTEIVNELNRYIIGQEDAKKAVAISIRNRWRRLQLPPEIQKDIIPKNIIMIGSTGVGKTEIARRIAQLTNAPFIKVEATKYTEVGYHGRDVESIIRDLMKVAYEQVFKEFSETQEEKAQKVTEDKILNILVPPRENTTEADTDTFVRDKFRARLIAGELDDKEIEIQLEKESARRPFMASFNSVEDIGSDFQEIMNEISNKSSTRTQKTTIKEAKKLLTQEVARSFVDQEAVTREAINRVENTGIVFIDEIDKVAGKNDSSNPDISRGGVQRDLLPIIEGSAVTTRRGVVNTDHILFIAAGAFHTSKPSDLIPELQGRFPIRVELESLTKEDYVRILKEPKNSLLKQYEALLSVESIQLNFQDDAIEEIAAMAFHLNEKVQNIGARRLYTVLEKILQDISFAADTHKGQTISLTAQSIKNCLKDLVTNEDLSKYIL